MTRSYGGRDPGKGPRDKKPSERSGPSEDPNLASWNANSSKPINRAERSYQIVKPVYVDPKKRGIAIVFDFIACYVLGAIIGVVFAFIPLSGRFFNSQIVAICFLLARDALFQGRGIGKNLMGLQVVDVNTGEPASLKQSVLRNIVLLAPFLVFQVAILVVNLLPIPQIGQGILQIVNIVCTLYVLVVIPLESWRAYKREDSLRIGDEIAGTAIIEAPMDFSSPLPR